MLLVLWPRCWEHPACPRTAGVQTETPSPGAALLGLGALGGCQVGQRCPCPGWLHRASGAVCGHSSHIPATRVPPFPVQPENRDRVARRGDKWQWQVGGDAGGRLYSGGRVTQPSSATPAPTPCPRHRSEARCGPTACSTQAHTQHSRCQLRCCWVSSQ